jgi:hypothetical protein
MMLTDVYITKGSQRLAERLDRLWVRLYLLSTRALGAPLLLSMETQVL